MAEAKAIILIPHSTKTEISYEERELVLCKDCKYVAPDMACGHPDETLNPLSRNHDNPYWFCADGERKK